MEVEVKARVENLEDVKKKLVELGVQFNGSVSHNDRYFKPKGFDQRVQGPGDYIVRIRKEGNNHILTTKALTEIMGAWIEHETEIDNPGEMEKMLLMLGLVNVFDLNKTREVGRLGEFEVLLDDVKELGKFIEVALDSEEGKKEENRKRIIEFFSKIGLKEEALEKRGYGELIGEQLGHKFGGMR